MPTLAAVTVSARDGNVLRTELVTLSSRVSHVSVTSIAEASLLFKSCLNLLHLVTVLSCCKSYSSYGKTVTFSFMGIPNKSSPFGFVVGFSH